MNYEKKYNKLVEAIKVLQETNPSDEGIQNWVNDNVPELADSEDERIRKAISQCVEDMRGQFEKLYNVHHKDALAWLEKQGGEQNLTPPIWKYKKDDTPLSIDSLILNKYGCVAKSPSGALVSDVWVIDFEELAKLPKEEVEKQGEQKSADKVEPKFHEGDWVIYNNDICQIVKLEEGCNILVTQFGVEKEPVNERNLSTAKLWDISDAKDGDVLVDEDDCPFIFKGFLDSESPYSPVAYCGIDSGDSFFACKYNDYWTENECQPATKEQREQLEKAMVDAGWEFDFEKKELKKISQRIVSAEVKEAMYDKPAWSEDDERRLNIICGLLEDIPSHQNWLRTLKNRVLTTKVTCDEKDKEKLESIINKASYNCCLKNDDISFLKSLKGRVQPQQQEWSEEDGRNLQGIIDEIEANKNQAPDYDHATYDRFLNWLKSLKKKMEEQQ